jgi:uncharacterized protein
MMTLQSKTVRLNRILQEMERVAVAFSGGVDSSLLLKVAHDVLGDGAIALTAVSPSVPTYEQEKAEVVAKHIGVRQERLESYEMEDDRYTANTPQRCFFCKNETYERLIDFAKAHGYQHLVDGTNADDAGDHRPGRQAAEQLGVRSPLMEVGFTKQEIRRLARQLGLPNWDKPAAACLSSRIPYGTTVTIGTLSQVEHAETILREMGFRQLRVRHHDQIARIEVEPGDLQAVVDKREEILRALKSLGYLYVTLDLAGFHSGSMNETLNQDGS